MPRDKERKRYTSATERANKQSLGFQASYLKLPTGVQLLKVKQGVMLLDILPFAAGEGNPWAEEGKLHWERTYYTHRGIGADSSPYLCPRMSSKQPCPICEARARLSRENDEENEDLIKDLAPKQRQLFNVINLREPEKGVQLLDMSYHLFGKVLDARLRGADEDDQWDSFFHLEDGLTLKVNFEEKTFGGRAFLEATSIDFKPRREAYDDEMLDKVHCLDELLIEPDYDDLKKTFLQTGTSSTKPTKRSEPEEEEEDQPRRKTRPEPEEEPEDEPAPKRKARPEPEPEEEDEPAPKKKVKDDDNFDDFDDAPPKKKARPEPEEEDEPAPKRKSRPEPEPEDEDEAPPKKAKKPAVEEDQDDLPWDDDAPPKKSKARPEPEEDDEPPKKKAKAAVDDDGWDDDEPPKKAKKPAVEEEEEEDPAPKKKVRR